MIDSYVSAVAQGEPELFYPHLREAGGLGYIPELNMYLVGDYPGAREVLSDPSGESFLKDLSVVPWWLLNGNANPLAQEVMGSFHGYPGAIVGEVGQRHLRRRRIIGAAMNRADTGVRNVVAVDELVARHVHDLRTKAAEAAVSGDGIDLQRDFINPISLELMAYRLDLPAHTKELVAASAEAQSDFTWPTHAPPFDEQPRLARELIVMRDQCADLIDDHLEPGPNGQPRPDSVTRHLAMAVRGGHLTREEAIANLFGLINASYVTTAGTVTRYIDHLVEGGDWASVDPESPSLADQVAEGMSVWTGVHGWLRRTADSGAQLRDGRRLERGGAHVLVLIEAANQDPARGDDLLLSFSPGGQHRCLGENEAVRVGTAIVRALKKEFPVLRRDGRPERRANLAFRIQSDLSVTTSFRVETG